MLLFYLSVLLVLVLKNASPKLSALGTAPKGPSRAPFKSVDRGGKLG
jgi:hypothetical protein